MKRLFLVLFFFCNGLLFSQQSLAEYSFIVVPEQFEFFDQKDKYELNSMAKFYLEKKGMTPYFLSELPNFSKCEGIYFDVKKTNNLFLTILHFEIKDCQGTILYESEEGKSQIKDFRQAYQDALRKAFQNFNPSTLQGTETVTIVERDDNQLRTVSKETENDIEIEVENTSNLYLPTSRYTGYSRDGKNYLLQKTNDTYVLFEENPAAENGLKKLGEIIPENETLVFKTAAKSGTASFSKDGLLTLELDTSKEVYKPIR